MRDRVSDADESEGESEFDAPDDDDWLPPRGRFPPGHVPPPVADEKEEEKDPVPRRLPLADEEYIVEGDTDPDEEEEGLNDGPEKSLELLAIPRQVNEVAGGKAYFLAHWDHFVGWFFLYNEKVMGDPEKLQLLLNRKVGLYKINSVDPA